MTQNNFLSIMEKKLKKLEQTERKDILADYTEHFISGLEEGRTEEEIAGTLGNPILLAKAQIAENLTNKAESERNLSNITQAVLATVSLSLFNIIFFIGPFFGLLGGLIGLWAGAVSLVLSGVATLGGLLFSSFVREQAMISGLNIWFFIFAGIGVTCLGVLASIGMWFLSKWFSTITLKYVKLNISIVKKRSRINE
jgi:uncharacterized membrane protein